ncbi:cation transporter [Nocardia transvalensis]|uniref:cation diffusion facilitator family transporter n=1 Tax=Nocardia transvalensis TaxID=37333 RepID=UPI002B4B0509|nr:cation transporter [Nocardia transvalensis]
MKRAPAFRREKADTDVGGESARTVVIAFGVNVAIALAKSVAATLSGSASMVAEAAHSWADAGNQIFLLVAGRRSARAADTDHPLGYGREAYVWSLLAAVGLFVAGAAVSVWHGITELLHESVGEQDYTVAYIVLAVAFVLESTSWMQATRQLRAEAESYDRDILEYVLDTSDPMVRAVFAEDSAALIGLVIAAAGMGLHQLTGVAWWDALGSILVGVLLGVVAVVLIDRNRRFLTGEPASDAVRAAAIARIEQMPEVAAVRFVRLEYVGPKQVFLVASVDLEGDDAESRIAPTLRALEHELERNKHVVKAVLTVSDPSR